MNGYFIICFLLAITCMGIAIGDCVNKATREEFMLLPELNVAQYKKGGTLEERRDKSERSYEYWTSLEDDQDKNDIPTRILSIGMTAGICNLVVYYLACLFKIRIRKIVSILFYIECGIFLLLILMLRLYVHNCYGEDWIKDLYGLAFITWREIFIPVLVVSILTIVVRFSRDAN